MEIIKAKMYQRRDTSSNWLKYNPVLGAGEFGYDQTKKRYKIGDGVTHWNDLEFSYVGTITDENGEVLRYKKIASEEYVNEQISSVIFKDSKLSFPSTGLDNQLYVSLDNNMVYLWDSSSLTYETIGTDIVLPEEQLIPLIEDAVSIVLVDKLKDEVPEIVKTTIETSVLSGGNSTDILEDTTETVEYSSV